jgi:hypothetical protein
LNLEFPAPNSMSADAGLRSMLTNPFAQTGKYIRFFSLRQLNEFAAVWEKQSPTIRQAIQDKVGEFGDPSSFFFTFPLLSLSSRSAMMSEAGLLGSELTLPIQLLRVLEQHNPGGVHHPAWLLCRCDCRVKHEGCESFSACDIGFCFLTIPINILLILRSVTDRLGPPYLPPPILHLHNS